MHSYSYYMSKYYRKCIEITVSNGLSGRPQLPQDSLQYYHFLDKM